MNQQANTYPTVGAEPTMRAGAHATWRISRRGWILVAALACISVVVLLVGAGKAEAYEAREFSITPSTTQAGGHPDITTYFEVENRLDPQLDHPCSCNDVRDIVVELPPGVIGNPHAYPRCTAAEFALTICPTDAQIGTANPQACLGPGLCIGIPVPLYNLEPQVDQAGLLGFKVIVFNSPVYTELSARTDGDYGLTAKTLGVQHALPLSTFEQVLWGIPADPSHDFQRYADLTGTFPSGIPTASNSPARPFTQNPTTCGVELTASLYVRAYNEEEDTIEASYPGTTGCAQLSFNPSLSARPTTTDADAPSGLEVDLTVPQLQSPTTPSPSQIRSVTVELPEGVSINPNAADGKLACSNAAANFGTLDAAQCPEHAKVGLLEIESSALPDDLPGAIYLGEPLPGNRYRLFLVADGFGIHVKLPGKAVLDSNSGQVTVSFEDLPQFPFERFNMHFFGAERGLLATPSHCGTYPVTSTFVPWDAELATQRATQFFNITSGPGGGPCPDSSRPFDPEFAAASTGNTAGAHAPFWLRLVRDDGHQNLAALDVTTPPGFSAKLAGIPYCPESALAVVSNPLHSGLAEIASSACPAESEIGNAVAGAGAGSRVLYSPGKVYLAGPHAGAPLSLVVVVPAVSGPYDLGNVVVRTALNVDPVSARITAVSDPIPSIMDGIPLRLRSLLIEFGREEFTLNPTNCAGFAVNASVQGDQGASVGRSAHYQVANCARLGFDPGLNLRLRGNSKRNGHPSLQAVLRPNQGDANLRRTVVTLPATTLLDQDNIGAPCTRPQFAAGNCPAASRYGTAVAHTPLLDQPLRGPVYLRSSNNRLPDLVADLRGQVNFEVSARIDSVRRRLRATFSGIPDVPVSRFVLRMQGGGRKGLIANSNDLCRNPARVRTVMVGQNGRRQVTGPRLKADCGARSTGAKKRRAAISISRKAG